MNPVRRLLLAFVGVASPLALTSADASAARARPRHRIAQVATATYYHLPSRPHVAHRLHAAHMVGRKFAQAPRGGLLTGS